MSHEQSRALDRPSATLQAGAAIEECVSLDGIFTIACYSAAGELLWQQDTASVAVERQPPTPRQP